MYESGSWINGPAMVYAKHFAAMTQSPFTDKPQYLFVTGGAGSSSDLSIAEILTDNGWELFSPSLPVAIYRHCMVLANSTSALVIGGQQNGISSAQTYLISDSRKVKSNLIILNLLFLKVLIRPIILNYIKYNRETEKMTYDLKEKVYIIENKLSKKSQPIISVQLNT